MEMYLKKFILRYCLNRSFYDIVSKCLIAISLFLFFIPFI